MQFLILFLMLYASCGLILSLVVHTLSFFGIGLSNVALFFGLHVGIFPLWIPVVFIAQKMTRGVPRKDFWKIALSECPTWMRYMTRGFFFYAILNFAIFVVIAVKYPPAKQAAGIPASVLHGFSGHWMAFYSAGLAILTTAYRRGVSNLQRHCPNGHEIGWNDQFCPICGLATVQKAS
jgi:hypothetical protein